MPLEGMETETDQGKTVLNSQSYDMCEIDIYCLFTHLIAMSYHVCNRDILSLRKESSY